MKKITCIVLTLILALAMAIGLTGCGAGKLKGTWRYTGTEGDNNVDVTITIYIENDEVYMVNERDYGDEVEKSATRYSGVKMLKEEQMLIFYVEDGGCSCYEYELVGDVLTLKSSSYYDSTTRTFHKI